MKTGRWWSNKKIVSMAHKILGSLSFTDAGCWEYQGTINKYGYPQMRFYGKTQRLHRWSYVIHKGRIPPGMAVMHGCDNKKCVNPEHLSLGTHEENRLDMMRKNRQAKGDRVATRKLCSADIPAIRADKRTLSKIAVDYGVTRHAIHRVKTRKWWRHVPDHMHQASSNNSST